MTAHAAHISWWPQSNLESSDTSFSQLLPTGAGKVLEGGAILRLSFGTEPSAWSDALGASKLIGLPKASSAQEQQTLTAIDSAWIERLQRINRLKNRLFEAAREASEKNWDGYGAEPVDAGAVKRAKVLIPLLPEAYGEPEIDIDPDGEVAFEWQTSPRSTFSFSVGPSGKVSYAGLRGHQSFHGTEYFVDELPSPIVDGLHRVLGGE